MFTLANSRRFGVRLMSAGLAATVLLTAACSDDDDGTGVRTASSITVTGGNTQTGTVGAALAQPLVVTVRDQSGNPLSGQTVTFATTSGGTLGTTTVTTNAQGQAQTTYMLGTTAGTQMVTARVAGVTNPATFSFTGNATTASNLVVVSGNNQTGAINTALVNPLVVEVRDQYGNIVPNSAITWTTTAGTFAGTPAATTDASGRATANFMFPATTGPVTVTAALASNPAATTTFTLTAQ